MARVHVGRAGRSGDPRHDLVTGPLVPANDGLSSLHAGFGSNTMTIIDQVGTVDVELWVKNESGASVSATCAVIVTSGTVHELYRGSAAFSLVSIEPHSSRHLLEGVTGVYLDGMRPDDRTEVSSTSAVRQKCSGVGCRLLVEVNGSA